MYHLPEAAALVNVDYNTLYKFVRTKRVLQPKKSILGDYYYTQADIEKLHKQIAAIKLINRNFFTEFNEKRIRREAK